MPIVSKEECNDKNTVLTNTRECIIPEKPKYIAPTSMLALSLSTKKRIPYMPL
jgi:hypothetical protein